jgi:uncharacterized glyoxalase superfamily protein PhnB
MLQNRSVPRSTVIPELAYDDVTKAAEWLCEVFGFTVRVRIGNHRVQLNVADGAMVVIERDSKLPANRSSVMVRIDDVHEHHERTKDRAHILRPPADYPYGERQYTVEDIGGHRWTFTQSIADVAPESWGGESGQIA